MDILVCLTIDTLKDIWVPSSLEYYEEKKLGIFVYKFLCESLHFSRMNVRDIIARSCGRSNYFLERP